jgi:hypothetical protein
MARRLSISSPTGRCSRRLRRGSPATIKWETDDGPGRLFYGDALITPALSVLYAIERSQDRNADVRALCGAAGRGHPICLRPTSRGIPPVTRTDTCSRMSSSASPGKHAELIRNPGGNLDVAVKRRRRPPQNRVGLSVDFTAVPRMSASRQFPNLDLFLGRPGFFSNSRVVPQLLQLR